MRCENCQIETNNTTDNCPLCGKYLSDSNKGNRDVYPKIENKLPKETDKWFKWLFFSTIIYSLFMIGIDLITSHGYYWSTIPILVSWMLWILFGVPVKNGKLTPIMMILDIVIISFLLIIIDITFSLQGWTMRYIGPLVPSGTGLIITLIEVHLKTVWKEFCFFQITIAAVCCIPIIAKLIFSFELWPSIVSAIYGIVTVLAMIMFEGKKFKYEAKKRLYF